MGTVNHSTTTATDRTPSVGTSNQTCDAVDLADGIQENLTAAIAVIDCVRVASSSGSAGGFQVVNGSVPLALTLAMNLLRDAVPQAQSLFSLARAEAK
jgi:O6-methylguanine-DNA--protein-cysteine methyltransferase